MYTSSRRSTFLLLTLLMLSPLFVGCFGTPGAPNPAFSVNERAGKADLTIQFTDNSDPGQSPITEWLWDFGDGSTSTEQHPQHTYTANGYKSVRLTISNDQGTRALYRQDYIFVGNVWARAEGTENDDLGRSIARMPNNGLVILGAIQTDEGVTDMRLTRYDADGEILWSNDIGGNRNDEAGALLSLADGDIVVAGTTRSFGNGGKDILVVRFDLNGNERWSNTYGSFNNEAANAIVLANDGGFLIGGEAMGVGSAFPNPYFLKISSSGQQQWTRFVSVSGSAHVSGITTLNNGYAFTGTSGIGNTNVLVGRLENDGEPVWVKEFGGFGEDRGAAIAQVGNTAEVLVVGTRTSGGATGIDMAAMRINGDGEEVWTRFYGGPGRDEGRGVIPINNGFLLIGLTNSRTAGGADAFLVNIDNSGEPRWTRTIGGPGTDVANNATTLNNGYGIVGSTRSFGEGDYDIYILRTNQDGLAPAIPPGASTTGAAIDDEENGDGAGEG